MFERENKHQHFSISLFTLSRMKERLAVDGLAATNQHKFTWLSNQEEENISMLSFPYRADEMLVKHLNLFL